MLPDPEPREPQEKKRKKDKGGTDELIKTFPWLQCLDEKEGFTAKRHLVERQVPVSKLRL